ncbi:putative trans-sialidase [Trypanosoma rangeli]|uniref:Putative trans-sialidase n=1 Tax=Trypanosoma rangeli TaxID=5698 RepID=A0A3R7MXN1_TRYRA|nr:putative trans-sialidase [Trypanosoma rangeli]RNE96866.1 putative trans-sialidase [Trypanosoma rangeli]|eukprot:RNE96866.1 putative trans-sialidase [Trypanosoma rangeli]
MPRQLFYSAVLLLCVLSMCGSGSGAAEAKDIKPEAAAKTPSTVELFKRGNTPSGAAGLSGLTAGRKVYAFTGHSLVGAKGVVVALAKARYGPSLMSGAGIWATCISPKGDGNSCGCTSVPAVATGDGCQWTKVVPDGTKAVNPLGYLYGPKAVVKDDKILLLLMSYKGLQGRRNKRSPTPSSPRGPPSSQSQPPTAWEVALYEATVADSSGTKSLTWTKSTQSTESTSKDPSHLKTVFTAAMKTHKWRSFVDNAGRGVVDKSKKVVFPLVAVSSESGAHVCTVLYSTNGGSAASRAWKFPSSGAVAEGCVAATLLEWGGKLLMIATDELQRYRLYESGGAEAAWKEVTGSHAYLLGDFLKGVERGEGDDFITATIDGAEVVLFSRQWHSYDDETKTIGSVLQLWMTDNKRMHPVGPIATDPLQSHEFSALLYAKDDNKLFAVYERRDNTSSGLIFAPLTEQLQRVKDVLGAWKKADAKVAALCGAATTAGEPAQSGAACNPPVPTDGLVGFLSDAGNATQWADDYLWMNATVREATKIANGFNLTGPASRIVWPVVEQAGAPAYSFAGRGLTVVATATIRRAPTSATTLLGVGVSVGRHVLELSLSYDEGKRWRTGGRGGASTAALPWMEGATYQVALTVRDVSGSAYVDGEMVGSLGGNSVPASGPSSTTDAGDGAVTEEMLLPLQGDLSYVFFGGNEGRCGGCEGTK